MYDSPNRFLDQPEDSVWQHVKVNIAGVLMITRLVLPGMVSRRRGLVINMSSIAGYQPLPLMGVYSASKKFVEYFSETLEYEYKSSGIEVQTLVPSYISTKMTKWSSMLQKPGIITPNANSFARSAIATIGALTLLLLLLTDSNISKPYLLVKSESKYECLFSSTTCGWLCCQ